MNRLSNFGIWYNRILLLLVAILFAIIALRNLVHPIAAATQSNIILSSATALSVARVTMGALPLGFAIFIFISLFSEKQISRAVLLVFILIGITTVVRISSLQLDGHSDFGQKVLVPEISITVLSALGLYLDQLRRRKQKNNLVISTNAD
jgi:uncharacterized protein DUF4345